MLTVNGKDYLLRRVCSDSINIFEFNEADGRATRITRIPVEENYKEVAVAAIIAHQAIRRAAAVKVAA